ncbi:uncharacterized protein [Montipora foliosa]|uniref:uncharacterized protein isoform X2 n=1 Tax=Montipora foliosa TaxID=591990 RepID=UPI0035F128CF
MANMAAARITGCRGVCWIVHDSLTSLIPKEIYGVFVQCAPHLLVTEFAEFAIEDEKVIIVIGGDDNYKDEEEKQGSVLSRWAYRQVSSQFDEKLMDGRKSFIFSWEKEHRPIHEEAMIHFLDPHNNKQKFVPKPIPVLTLEQRGDKTEDDQNPPRGTNPLESLNGLERQRTSEEERKFEAPPDSPNSFEDDKENEPEAKDFVIVEKPSAEPRANKNVPQLSVAILYRNESDLAFIEDVFGDLLSLGISPMSCKDPSDLNQLISTNPVRSCFVMLTAEDLKDTRYTELLKTAQSTVEKRIVIILCDTDEVSRDEEQAITEAIGDLLGEKSQVLCLKNLPKSTDADLTRSHPNPRKEGAIAKPARESSSGNFEHHDRSSKDPIAHETGQSCPVLFPDAVPKQSVAILYRNSSDLTLIDDVFGERVSVGISPMSSQDPTDLKFKLISASPVRSCFIMLPAGDWRNDRGYDDFLRTAQSNVEKKIVIILCDTNEVLPDEEQKITENILKLLGEQGVVLCLKNLSQSAGADVSGSQSCPSNKSPAAIPEKDLKLLLHTRLRHGKISYDKNDVKHREKEWEAPEGMKKGLYEDWNTTVNAEIKIYRNTRNGEIKIHVNHQDDSGGASSGMRLVRNTWSFVKSFNFGDRR